MLVLARNGKSRLLLCAAAVALLACALLVSVYFALVQRSAQRQAAIAAVTKNRGWVTPDWKGPQWLLLGASDEYFADRFRFVCRMRTRPRSPQRGVYALRNQVRLDALLDWFVTVDRVNDLRSADAVYLHQLAEVREVSFRDADDMGAVVGFLRRSTGLVELSFEVTNFRDFGDHELPSLPHLEVLDLSMTEANDAALASIARSAPNLQRVDLTDTKVTEATAAQLTNSAKLRFVALRNCPVTDAWIPEFLKMPELQQLDLRETQISEAGIARLSAAGIEVQTVD
ncbi:MAG TPA: hypothetical protein VHB77_07510 [Planctomycetaceae bacterium]|nr:hypothetical protein [Planctomycetaceae bacterium]